MKEKLNNTRRITMMNYYMSMYGRERLEKEMMYVASNGKFLYRIELDSDDNESVRDFLMHHLFEEYLNELFPTLYIKKMSYETSYSDPMYADKYDRTSHMIVISWK